VNLRRRRRALPQCTCRWPQAVHGTERDELVCLCGGKVSREGQPAAETAEALGLMDPPRVWRLGGDPGIHRDLTGGYGFSEPVSSWSGEQNRFDNLAKQHPGSLGGTCGERKQ
jgi:hypothetical protein